MLTFHRVHSFRVWHVTFLLTNPIEHQELDKTTAEPQFGFVYGVLPDFLQTQDPITTYYNFISTSSWGMMSISQ